MLMAMNRMMNPVHIWRHQDQPDGLIEPTRQGEIGMIEYSARI